MVSEVRFERATELRIELVELNATDAESENRVARHWADALQKKPLLFNGPLLSPVGVTVRDGCATLEVKKSDYAHYLYARSIGSAGGVPISGTIFVSLVVPSGTSRFVAGRMAKHTAAPGIVQLPGGGVSDLTNPRFAAIEEAAEELGLELQAERLRMLGVIVRGAPLDVGVVYLAPRQQPAVLKVAFESLLAADRAAERESEFEQLLEFEVGDLDGQHPDELLVDYLSVVAQSLIAERWHE